MAQVSIVKKASVLAIVAVAISAITVSIRLGGPAGWLSCPIGLPVRSAGLADRLARSIGRPSRSVGPSDRLAQPFGWPVCTEAFSPRFLCVFDCLGHIFIYSYYYLITYHKYSQQGRIYVSI
ncbi:hypothetical protein HanRHA438_Chr08g0347041 [Helianthus annuus]|nr:hypothetical protein HanHA300_Chr08g0277251 [Helianthus annuus]KAJ0553269.1 hypothetical protein HanHA89_Chr08g0294551 [Helianthus annuus]KAJ0897560.1 hypothetical protein HanRHA438_Chr08g0347041 [Helianthus annuus]